MNLAFTLAEAARAESEARIAAEEAAMLFPIEAPEVNDLPTPMFLHERELGQALRVITLLASGRNPFSDEPIERLRQDQRTELLRALSIVVCTLMGTPTPVTAKQKPVESDTTFDSPESKSVDSPKSSHASNRPLEEYLDRLEREAILEAIAEAGTNQTEAARLLGITYRSYRYRIERLKIIV